MTSFKTLASLAALSLSYALSPIAHAETITFNNLTEFTAVANGYDGFNWNNSIALNVASYQASYGPSGYTNGADGGNDVIFNGGGAPMSLSLATPGTFTLNSLSLASAWYNNETITVTGFDNGIKLDTAVFILSTAAPTLESLNWSGINSIDLSASGGTSAGYNGAGDYIALDSLTVNADVAPEPSSLVLLGTGAFGIIGAARRRYLKA